MARGGFVSTTSAVAKRRRRKGRIWEGVGRAFVLFEPLRPIGKREQAVALLLSDVDDLRQQPRLRKGREVTWRLLGKKKLTAEVSHGVANLLTNRYDA